MHSIIYISYSTLSTCFEKFQSLNNENKKFHEIFQKISTKIYMKQFKIFGMDQLTAISHAKINFKAKVQHSNAVCLTQNVYSN